MSDSGIRVIGGPILFVVISTAIIFGFTAYVNYKYGTEVRDVIKVSTDAGFNDPMYELIYSDPDEGMEYYRFVGNTRGLKKGDTVSVTSNEKFKVLKTDSAGFDIEYNDYFTPGMSGTKVYNEDGVAIGLISKLVDSSYVHCIWN